jgi:hypothetical protein
MKKIYGQSQNIYKSYFGLKVFCSFFNFEVEKEEINISNNNKWERKLSFDHNPTIKKKKLFVSLGFILKRNSLELVFPSNQTRKDRSSLIFVLWIQLLLLF